uniref:Uncharacterized protein n=1 Tax=Arundo donax TaxID=35708 RepID=A0A0A9A3Z3_ARUDO
MTLKYKIHGIVVIFYGMHLHGWLAFMDFSSTTYNNFVQPSAMHVALINCAELFYRQKCNQLGLGAISHFSTLPRFNGG